ISFRFSDLPTELALIIFEHAARPTFAQYAPYTKDPYLSALSLCKVSKIVRRTVLPELLHTVLLLEACHLLAFIRALRMQKKYIDQQHELAFDYASCIHRVSIGEFWGAVRDPLVPFYPPVMAKLDWELDISLLAPVILGVPSLAINFDSLDILSKCLKNVYNSNVDLNIDHRNYLRPWSTKSLTLLGHCSTPWWSLVESAHGYAFLASIQHLTVLFPT
ncbi:uncharacterized protein EDB93DRAFT_1052525, partial [Suillus bovinus]|uniref:uncharacterized protein n=1 Tax=Suillus bovinus TaxID=48563 RepID=UPI001B87F414